jgi:hypothetical protein
MVDDLDATENVQGESEFSSAVRGLHDEVLEQFKQCARVGYCSIGKEVQEDVRSAVKLLAARISSLKLAAIERDDEGAANLLLALVFLVRALHGELTMWIALKEDRADFAWDRLVDAQGLVQAALRAHHRLEPALSHYLQKLDILQKLLFPPQIFFSIGAVIESIQCSICGEEYGTCRHVIGLPYMGQMCCEVLNDVRDLKECSIVEAPHDKCCRALSREDAGVKTDMLTGRILPCDPADEGNAELAKHIRVHASILRFANDSDPCPE